ncbi:hypothetical protein AAVH_17097 [Aphelenchoides avenae]|nr:hypothetical protein AAVH_17097 [Aphelenchus avenae]
MPLYYDLNCMIMLACALVFMMRHVYYDILWSWLYWLLMATSCVLSCYCAGDSLAPFYHGWRQQPAVQLNNAAPANGNAAQLQRGRLRHLPGLRRMLADVFQCLPRAGLDAGQLVSRQFRDAIEDSRTTLPLYSMVVSLVGFSSCSEREATHVHALTLCDRPCGIIVRYDASIVDVGSVTGFFFTGLRRCDSLYFRNAVVSLRAQDATYERTSTDMISSLVRGLDLGERNLRFTDLRCEAYADELEDIFRFTDRHDIRSLFVVYKRSLVTPGCDFLSTLFAEARKRQFSQFVVSLASVNAKNCVSSFPEELC